MIEPFPFRAFGDIEHREVRKLLFGWPSALIAPKFGVRNCGEKPGKTEER